MSRLPRASIKAIEFSLRQIAQIAEQQFLRLLARHSLAEFVGRSHAKPGDAGLDLPQHDIDRLDVARRMLCQRGAEGGHILLGTSQGGLPQMLAGENAADNDGRDEGSPDEPQGAPANHRQTRQQIPERGAS